MSSLNHLPLLLVKITNENLLRNNSVLGVANFENLFFWLNSHFSSFELNSKDAEEKRKRWKEEKGFFLESDLFFYFDDIILLSVFEMFVQNFFLRYYTLEKQKICEKVFGDKKKILILTNKQKELFIKKKKEKNKIEGKIIVLWDREEALEEEIKKHVCL